MTQTLTITREQLKQIEYALTLAEYFVDGQEQGTPLHRSDSETLRDALIAIDEIRKGLD
jgi:hypothetical protein